MQILAYILLFIGSTYMAGYCFMLASIFANQRKPSPKIIDSWLSGLAVVCIAAAFRILNQIH